MALVGREGVRSSWNRKGRGGPVDKKRGDREEGRSNFTLHRTSLPPPPITKL